MQYLYQLITLVFPVTAYKHADVSENNTNCSGNLKVSQYTIMTTLIINVNAV